MTNAALARIDSAIFGSLIRAEIGDLATYQDETTYADDVRVVIDRDVQLIGDQGQVIGSRDMAAILRADVPNPVIGATLTVGEDSWLLDRPMEGQNDESMQQWALTHV